VSKRLFDFVAAAVAILVLCPVWLAIAALVWLEDGGSPLFVQSRVGRGRRPFRIYKFRTMTDGGVTRVGHTLRTTGLDELPQLVNVLRGEMSIVGPRPLLQADITRLGWDGAAHAARWLVAPGITGLAQLYAGRGARLSWFLDRRDIETRCLHLDLAIIGLSAVMAIIGKRPVRGWLRRQRRAASNLLYSSSDTASTSENNGGAQKHARPLHRGFGRGIHGSRHTTIRSTTEHLHGAAHLGTHRRR